ncbi:MAG TPA: hypothetical protein VL688_08560 [Verrucomicrobiae bacterium]|jgi:hypothetical protein|nr:hypothetical protein [Verrucomicrobiae bacterium]
MNRELAGIIACMQEIEIACRVLKKRDDLKWVHAIPEIQERLVRFFREASVPRAKEVEQFVQDLGSGYRSDDSEDNILNARIEIDRTRTTLASLCEELREVIEDSIS